jgi:hypothetical protein
MQSLVTELMSMNSKRNNIFITVSMQQCSWRTIDWYWSAMSDSLSGFILK